MNCVECGFSLASGQHVKCFEKTPAGIMLAIRAIETRKLPNKKELMEEARNALSRFLPKPLPSMPRVQRDDWLEDYFKPWLSEQPIRKSKSIEE